MLYYPTTEKPAPHFLTAHRLQYWGAAEGDYRGVLGPAPKGTAKGTIIVFHGNAGSAADRVYYDEVFAPLGYRVLLAEYPGYGGRPGALGEASFVPDARETIRRAFGEFGAPVYLLGESLGCGVAAAAAGESPVPIAGMLLITPWDSLRAVAKEHFPWLPVRLFLKDKYDSIANLKAFTQRIAVVGAEKDDIVPLRRAEALHQSLSGPKKMWIVRGAGHNDWFDAVGPSWWEDVMGFVAGKENKR